MENQEIATVRDAVACGWPYGDAEWTLEMTQKFALNRDRRLRGQSKAVRDLAVL
jgi:hypothetical protein